MIRHWEEFPVGPGGEGGRMHVTLSRKGEILVGRETFEKMGQPESAVLLFDKVNSTIGVRPTYAKQINAYPFKSKPQTRYRVIRANRFCRHHQIAVDRTVAFGNPVLDEDGTLVLDLRETFGVGKR